MMDVEGPPTQAGCSRPRGIGPSDEELECRGEEHLPATDVQPQRGAASQREATLRGRSNTKESIVQVTHFDACPLLSYQGSTERILPIPQQVGRFGSVGRERLHDPLPTDVHVHLDALQTGGNHRPARGHVDCAEGCTSRLSAAAVVEAERRTCHR